MEMIKKLFEMMEEELEGAEEYLKDSIKHMHMHPDVSRAFYEMSQDELKHATMLRDIAIKVKTDEHNKNPDLHTGTAEMVGFMNERYAKKNHNLKLWQDEYKHMHA